MPKKNLNLKKTNIFSADYNLRECVKQLLLLEDHLAEEVKFCSDCITKHLMITEALAEEAVTLEPDNPLISDAHLLSKKARQWLRKFNKGGEIAKDVRKVRKKIMLKVSNAF